MIDNTAALIGQMYIELSRIEEETVVRVLTELFQREPTKDELSDCVRSMDRNDHTKYTLSYRSIVLGTIERKFPTPSQMREGHKIGVQFTPHPQWH